MQIINLTTLNYRIKGNECSDVGVGGCSDIACPNCFIGC